jgi:hypothetical protein
MRANSAMNLFPMRIGSDEQSLFLSTGANKFTASIIAKGLVFGVFIKTGNSPTLSIGI